MWLWKISAGVIQWPWLRESNIEYAMTTFGKLAHIKTSSGKEREYLEQINKLLVEKNALVGANAQWEKDVKFLNDELNDIREKYASMHKVFSGGHVQPIIMAEMLLLCGILRVVFGPYTCIEFLPDIGCDGVCLYDKAELLLNAKPVKLCMLLFYPDPFSFLASVSWLIFVVLLVVADESSPNLSSAQRNDPSGHALPLNEAADKDAAIAQLKVFRALCCLAMPLAQCKRLRVYRLRVRSRPTLLARFAGTASAPARALSAGAATDHVGAVQCRGAHAGGWLGGAHPRRRVCAHIFSFLRKKRKKESLRCLQISSCGKWVSDALRRQNFTDLWQMGQ
jgi:hypothetical protein